MKNKITKKLYSDWEKRLISGGEKELFELRRCDNQRITFCEGNIIKVEYTPKKAIEQISIKVNVDKLLEGQNGTTSGQ